MSQTRLKMAKTTLNLLLSLSNFRGWNHQSLQQIRGWLPLLLIHKLLQVLISHQQQQLQPLQQLRGCPLSLHLTQQLTLT